MTDDTTPTDEAKEEGEECAECRRLGDIRCANCFIYEGKNFERHDDHADDGLRSDGGARDGKPVADLADLDEGDRVLWGDRKRPLVVRRTTFGSHVMVEGPGGAVYRVQPDPRGGFRLGYRGGNIAAFRRVERTADATDEDDEGGQPGGRGG